MERELAKLVAENERLRDQLGKQETTINYLVSKLSSSSIQGPAVDNGLLQALHEEVKNIRQQQEQLLSEQQRQNEQMQCNTTHSVTVTSPDTPQVTTESYDLLGIGEGLPVDDKHLSRTNESQITTQGLEPSHNESEGRSNRPVTYRNADGDLAIIPFTTHRTSTKRGANPRPGKARFHIPSYHHNRLLNSACFTEDIKSETELEQFWQRFAQENGICSSEQWRNYYESHVRPIYLARQPSDSPLPAALPQEQAVTSPTPAAVLDREAVLSSPFAAVPETERSNHRSASTSTVDVWYEGNCIELEYNDQPQTDDQQDTEHVIEEAKIQHTANIANPSLLGTAEQLAEARSFLQGATKGRGRNSYQPCESPDLIEMGATKSSLAQSIHAASTPLLNDAPDQNHNAAILLTGISTNASTHDLFLCLKPKNMICARFAKTAGMKTNPPVTTNTLLIVFPSRHLATLFSSTLESRLFELQKTLGAAISMTQFTEHCKIFPQRLTPLINRGAACGLLVKIEDAKFKAQALLDLINDVSENDPVTTFAMIDKPDGDVFFLFASITMSWRAYNILLDHADLHSRYVDPWAEREEEEAA